MTDEETADLAKVQAIYAKQGYLVMSSIDPINHGPLKNNWVEPMMEAYRWSVIANATKEEALKQCADLGDSRPRWSGWRYFYRIVALD